MAYARMGAVYGNSGEVRLAQESTQKAFDLRERTSEREKFYITAHYYSDVTGEVYKSIETTNCGFRPIREIGLPGTTWSATT